MVYLREIDNAGFRIRRYADNRLRLKTVNPARNSASRYVMGPAAAGYVSAMEVFTNVSIPQLTFVPATLGLLALVVKGIRSSVRLSLAGRSIAKIIKDHEHFFLSGESAREAGSPTDLTQPIEVVPAGKTTDSKVLSTEIRTQLFELLKQLKADDDASFNRVISVAKRKVESNLWKSFRLEGVKAGIFKPEPGFAMALDECIALAGSKKTLRKSLKTAAAFFESQAKDPYRKFRYSLLVADRLDKLKASNPEVFYEVWAYLEKHGSKAQVHEIKMLRSDDAINILRLFREKETFFGERTFTLIRQLRGAGMSTVFLAKDDKGRIVVIKSLPITKELEEKPDYNKTGTTHEKLERFRREVQTQPQFHHPNIIKTIEAGEIRGLPYIVMEYVNGGDLGEYINASHEEKSVNLIEKTKIMIGICAGLIAIAQKGIVHRDIKPLNIFIEKTGNVGKNAFLGITDLSGTCIADAVWRALIRAEYIKAEGADEVAIILPKFEGIKSRFKLEFEGLELEEKDKEIMDRIFEILSLRQKLTPKIADFGIMKFIGTDDEAIDDLTRTGKIMGSPKFMSPEQISPPKDVDFKLDWRSDQFAFGVVCYNLLTHYPFEGKDNYALARDILERTDDRAKFNGLIASIPYPEFRPIIGKMMAYSREARYSTYEELILDFERIKGGMSE